MDGILKHHPCDPKWPVSQTFGENPQNYAQFGLLGHDGVDFALPIGEPVYAMSSGRIVEVANDPPGYGLYIKARTDFGEWLVAHLSETRVVVGQNVIPGQVIALSGNSGNSTGPHLHVSMRVSPFGLQDGYNGRSDPLPYINQIGKRLGSLLGAHVIGQARPYLDQLRRLEPRVCLFLDPNRDDVRAFREVSPHTIVVGRIYVPDAEVAQRIKDGPTAAAAWANQLVVQHQAKDLCDYWQIANEVLQVNWQDFQLLVAFERERMRLADQAGYKCGILAFSVGQPDLPENDRAGYWRATYPALEYAEQNDHALILHQYGCCPNIWGPSNKGGSDWLLHRFEHQVRLFLPYKRLRVLVTEFGYDGLITAGAYLQRWKAFQVEEPAQTTKALFAVFNVDKPPGYKTAQTPEAYASDLINVQAYLERYSGQISGYTIFQLGDGGRWENYDIAGPVLEALAKAQEEKPMPPTEPSPELVETLTVQAQLNQVIQFNPDAALQKQIFADGFVPNSPEFSFDADGMSYIGQRAERLSDGAVRAYYVPIGQWDQVSHVDYDPSSVVVPPEPPEPTPSSDLEDRITWAEARLAALEAIHS